MTSSLFEKLDQHTGARLLLMLLLLFPIICGISFWTSPFVPGCDGDSAIFHMLGYGWTQGLLPYRDLFDHKGPLLFAIFSAGEHLCPGKWGIFILQWINLLICSHFVYRTARLKLPAGAAVWLILLAFTLCCFNGGALTEEWTLGLNLAPLYYLLRYLLHQENIRKSDTQKAIFYFLLGVSFGLQSMIRINNAAAVSGMIAFLFLYFLYHHSWKQLLCLAVCSPIGAVCAIAPFIFYFAVHHALYDFWYGTFGFNFIYAANGTADKSLADFATIALNMLFILLPIGAFFGSKNQQNRGERECLLCIITISLFSLLALIPGPLYRHYFVIASPCYIVVLTALVAFVHKRHQLHQSCIGAYLLLLVLLTPYALPSVKQMVIGWMNHYHSLVDPGCYGPGIDKIHYREVEAAQTLASTLPQTPENSILTYDLNPNFAICMRRPLCHRYFFRQSFFSQIAPSIRQEIDDFFASDQAPKWVITPWKVRPPHAERYEQVRDLGAGEGESPLYTLHMRK